MTQFSAGVVQGLLTEREARLRALDAERNSLAASIDALKAQGTALGYRLVDHATASEQSARWHPDALEYTPEEYAALHPNPNNKEN